MTIVRGWPHIVQNDACNLAATPGDWNNAAVCDNTVTVRRVQFANLKKSSVFDKTNQKVVQITDALEEVSTSLPSSDYSSIVSYLGSLEPGDKGKSYSLPYVTGSMYNIWWLTGLDFTHMSIFGSKYMTDAEPAVIFRVNYTEHR